MLYVVFFHYFKNQQIQGYRTSSFFVSLYFMTEMFQCSGKKMKTVVVFTMQTFVVLNLNSIEVVSTSPATVLMKHSKSER